MDMVTVEHRIGTRQYTVITICGESKKDIGRGEIRRWHKYGRYFSGGRKLVCRQVERTPGHRNCRLGLVFNRDAIFERAILDEVLCLLTLEHLLALHLELEWSLSTRYWVTIAIQYRGLLWLPATTTRSLAQEA
jgi:hypothetical protein